MAMVDNERESMTAMEKVENLKKTLLKQYNLDGKKLPISKDELLIAWLDSGIKRQRKEGNING